MEDQSFSGTTANPFFKENPFSLTSHAQATVNPLVNALFKTPIMSFRGRLYDVPQVQLSGTSMACWA